jgi:ATP-dependent DNA helicase DinG
VFDAADSTFAAALTGAEMIEIRRWVIGPEGKARGRGAGFPPGSPMSRAMTRKAGLPSRRRARRQRRCPAMAGLAASTKACHQGLPNELLAACAQRSMRATKGQAESGYGLETEYANLDGAPSSNAIADALVKALEALVKPLMVLGQRLEAIVEDAPDWLDGAARARIEGAMASLGWRVDTLRGWIALLGRGGGPADPDFVDWLAVDRGRGPRI